MRRICVYCGSSPGERAIYVETAAELGRALAARGLGLVYGGARVGCMGVVADAALAGGAEVHGVLPYGLQRLEVAHEDLTELHVVDSLHERKALMTELSDGFAVLPGGHGTHDELFEALTWLQLGIHSKPICLLNLGGYFDFLIRHLDRLVDEGFLEPKHRALTLVADDVESLLDTLASWTPPARPSWAVRD